MTDAGTHHGLGSIDTGLRIPAKMPLAFALHTRYGTTGERSLANSHPFTVTGSLGTVVGVHNGIISNHAALNAQHARACSVDSQHIFHHIANGIPLDDLEGYGAIVYTLNGEWYIGRFNDGEMKVAVTPSGIFYASTKDAVMQACSYADIVVSKWMKVSNNTIYKLTADGLVKSHRVKVGQTRLRWDDGLKGIPSARQGDAYDPQWWRGGAGDDFLLDCDYCFASVPDLYELHRDYVCAECYAAETNQLPAGYVDDMERSAYSYAASKAMAQGTR